MPVTLTDEQIAQLRTQLEAGYRAQQVAEGATQIWNDPNLSDRAKALWKEKFPEGNIPGYDTEQRINARLDKEKAERAEAEKKARDKAEDDQLAAKRRAVRERHNLNDEGMDKLEKLMVERGVADHEIAAHWLAAQEPAPSEGTSEYDRHFWQHDRSPEYREVASDPEGYARREILKAIRNDMQRTKS